MASAVSVPSRHVSVEFLSEYNMRCAPARTNDKSLTYRCFDRLIKIQITSSHGKLIVSNFRFTYKQKDSIKTIYLQSRIFLRLERKLIVCMGHKKTWCHGLSSNKLCVICFRYSDVQIGTDTGGSDQYLIELRRDEIRPAGTRKSPRKAKYQSTTQE